MTKQYLRKVMLSGSGVSINTEGDGSRDLKIEFDILKGVSSTQNESTIKVYNLKESSRNNLGKELAEVHLEAGYLTGNIGTIFKGNIRDIEHTRVGPDIISELKCGEGDKFVRNATINHVFQAKTEIKEVVEKLFQDMGMHGVTKGEFKFPDQLEPFKRPYAAIGSAKRELDLLGRGFGFYWFITNGVCNIIPGNGTLSGGSITITPESGMIGPPTIKHSGVKVTVLLDPAIVPGITVVIQSHVLEMNSQGGAYCADEVRHSGDNRDGHMITHIVGSAMKGGKVDEGAKNETVENSGGKGTGGS